ncbi:MAG: T9SS C-terminal target domain-containing protein [Bacteroidetes bacterium]|nr:MAG: T9SS C-terminal target domain-containing protein [Bacteroidota bacterium]
MKKRLLAGTIILLSILHLSAQPVLNSNEMMSPGTTVKFNYSNSFSVIDTTIKGANAIWDFSKLTPDGDQFDFTIMPPSQTPYGGLFTNANYCFKETPTAYRYFNLNQEKMERVGSYSNILRKYTDPQTEYVFPLQLGTENIDDWNNDQSSFGGTYSLKCLGYGTLKLPNGIVHNNVLMVSVLVTEIFDISAYYWYSSENGAALMNYVIGDGIFTNDVAFYAYQITNGNNSLSEVKPFGDVYYTNPVEHFLDINFPADVNKNVRYQIKDMQGKLTGKSGEFSTSTMASIDMGGLTKGLYLIELKDIDGNAQQFLKVFKY